MSLKPRQGSKGRSREQCKATTKAGDRCRAPAVLAMQIAAFPGTLRSRYPPKPFANSGGGADIVMEFNFTH